MKKKIFSVALVLAGMMGTTAIAQTPSSNTTPAAKEQGCPACPRGKQYNPFEGLNLTDKQQNDLKALRESRKADIKKEMSDKKADRKAMREQAQKNRKDYLAKVKGILTAEQYVQFLENSYLNNRAGVGSNNRKDMRNGNKKDGKKGMRGNRQGGQRPAATPNAN